MKSYDIVGLMVGLAGMIGIAFCIIFLSVPDTEAKESYESKVRNIADFEVVTKSRFSGSGVMVDRKTGVIYYYAVVGGKSGITPVLKSDGKPLLYSDIEEEL